MNESPYKGKILISTPDISGDLFSRSVVLVVENNAEGSFGLILNKKNQNLSFKLMTVFEHQMDVYDGGPVENDKIFFIIKDKKVTEELVDINDQYYITEDIENVITAILENQLEIANVKVFSGYSGWESGQLESEVKRKLWKVVDLYSLDFTAKNDDTLWKNIMENLGGEFLIFANTPNDISMN